MIAWLGLRVYSSVDFSQFSVSKQSHLLVGVFEDRAQAQKAHDELRRAGFG